MRKGIGIWQAIMVILLVSGMMMVVLKYASISARHVTDSYVSEQAELYLNSVIEKTLLAISAQDRSSGCLTSFSDSIPSNRGKAYSANVSIEKYYLYSGSDDAQNNWCGTLEEEIQTPESHGYVLLNVEVNATIDGKLRSRIIRRTLQRP